ncbi:MAG: hypothetical protein ACYSX0_07765 [Planctomycetota bacterium]|jgi:hypothetical protein
MSSILTAAAFAILSSQVEAADSPRLTRANAYFVKGATLAFDATKARTVSRRLRALRRATVYLRRSRRLSASSKEAPFRFVHVTATRQLVVALTNEAGIHFRRKAYTRARRRLAEVFHLDPVSPEARALDRAIKLELGLDVYERFEGAAGINRIRDRREDNGTDLRDRGRSRRN